MPDSTLSSLRALCAVPTNHVMILSGLGRDKVQQTFGSVPNLSLACEHGFHCKIKNGQWQQLLPGLNTSWREVAEAIMDVYAQRTSGSFFMKKGASIVWNYEQADPEFGSMQARELQYHLQGVLQAFPVVVRAGKVYVEVCPKGIDKVRRSPSSSPHPSSLPPVPNLRRVVGVRWLGGKAVELKASGRAHQVYVGIHMCCDILLRCGGWLFRMRH